jgi:hypothetical protein
MDQRPCRADLIDLLAEDVELLRSVASAVLQKTAGTAFGAVNLLD